MDRVKLGVVGCGPMAQLAHLPSFLGLERCEVVAVADLRPELGRKVAERFFIPKIYRSHKEMAEDPDIQAVASITNEALTPDIAVDLLNAGKHVYVEKPMAHTVADAGRMVEAAERNGRILMVAFMKRYDSGVELARGLIEGYLDSGKLGKMTYARCSCFGGNWWVNYGKPIKTEETIPQKSPNFPQWLPDEYQGAYAGVNVGWCHDINLIRFLVGREFAVEDALVGGGTTLVRFDAESVPVTFEGGGVSANYWVEECAVYFQDGWIKVKTPSPMLRNVPAEVEVYEAGEYQTVVHPRAATDWAFRREAEHFLDCILEGREPRTSGRDSIKDVELLEQIFRRGLRL